MGTGADSVVTRGLRVLLPGTWVGYGPRLSSPPTNLFSGPGRHYDDVWDRGRDGSTVGTGGHPDGEESGGTRLRLNGGLSTPLDRRSGEPEEGEFPTGRTHGGRISDGVRVIEPRYSRPSTVSRL